MIYNKLYYSDLKSKTIHNFGNLPKEVLRAICFTIINNNMFNVKGRCIEIARYLCDEINKVEPESAIVVCCKGFWRDKRYAENDLYTYQAHHFVKYKEWYIDLTLKQFNDKFPTFYISKSHLGKNQHLHQTYPEITDLNYINTLNNKL